MTGYVRDAVALLLLLAAVVCASTAVGLWVTPALGFAVAATPLAGLGLFLATSPEKPTESAPSDDARPAR